MIFISFLVVLVEIIVIVRIIWVKVVGPVFYFIGDLFGSSGRKYYSYSDSWGVLGNNDDDARRQRERDDEYRRYQEEMNQRRYEEERRRSEEAYRMYERSRGANV